MTDPKSTNRQPLVTSGTTSWNRFGAAAEHETLSAFLEDVAATDTIQSVIARATAAMQLVPGASALDVGCGTGAFFPAAATAVGSTGRLTGLDHGAAFLAEAAAKAGSGGYSDRLRLVQGDAHQLPFPDGTFDAAHTERVLMHLDGPDRALREMRRVVKAGGWVVCVEPDLVGMRLDAVDAFAAGQILAGFCSSIRHPAMGLELVRRMAATGLTALQVEVFTEVERDCDEDTAAFFARAAETAVAHGWLAAGHAEATLAATRNAAATGTYVSYSSMFLVAGRVPGIPVN